MAHEEIDAASLRAGDVYRLMTDLVAPRPIAWVGTVDGQGRRNLAPYSYFQAVCSAPATVVLGMGWMRDGRPKNSLANILETRGFTISHVRRGDAEAMNDTSVELPHGESEGIAFRSPRRRAPWSRRRGWPLRMRPWSASSSRPSPSGVPEMGPPHRPW